MKKIAKNFSEVDFVKSDENSWIFVLYNRKTILVEKYMRARL